MMQLWPGFAIDVVTGASGELLLCVDISHRILHRTSVLDQLKMVMGGGLRNSTAQSRYLAVKHFVGASVLARYSKVTYRVDDIDFEASPLSVFEVGSSNSQNKTTRMTFLEYYRTKWGLEIRELDQPLLVHQKRSTKTGEVSPPFKTFTFLNFKPFLPRSATSTSCPNCATPPAWASFPTKPPSRR